MPLDQAEIDQLTEAVKTDTIPDFLKPVIEKGYILRNPSQEEAFKTNYKGSVIGDRDKELYTNFETAIKEVAGIEKNPGEKATDYLKRSFTAATAELGELREAKKSGTLSALEKERLGQLETALKTKDTDMETLKQSHQKELLGYAVSTELGAAMGIIRGKLQKNLVGAEDIEAARLAKFNAEYKAEVVKDGDKASIIYRDAKGEVVNNKTTYKPATAAEILEGIFEPYMDKGAPNQPGGGSGPNQGGGAGGKQTEPATEETYAPAAGITTKVQLTDDLKRSGILAGTPAFSKLLAKFGKDLPTR